MLAGARPTFVFISHFISAGLWRKWLVFWHFYRLATPGIRLAWRRRYDLFIALSSDPSDPFQEPTHERADDPCARRRRGAAHGFAAGVEPSGTQRRRSRRSGPGATS